MKKYVNGLVSVIIPTYKRSEKLTRAIKSVLNQTYANIELLLINDNESNDKFTTELLTRIKEFESDSRFRLVLQEKHINGAVARNVGIKQAKGEFIAFLDDDDWWEKDKIEHQVKILRTLPKEWGGVSCRIKQYNNEKLIARLPRYKSGYVFKDILMLKSDFATGTILVKHSALDDAGYFDESLLRHQDLQLLVNFTYKYKLFQLDEFLHCCDVSDAQNRPDLQRIIEVKKSYFKSVTPIIKTLTKNEQQTVLSVHRYEIAYIALKNKQYKSFFFYFISASKSFTGGTIMFKKTLSKCLERIKND